MNLLIARLTLKLEQDGGKCPAGIEHLLNWQKLEGEVAAVHQGIGSKVAATLIPCVRAARRAEVKERAIAILLEALREEAA